MGITETILEKIKKNFFPEYIELQDESHKHSGNRKETHFKLILTSEVFKGLTILHRHRMVHDVLKEELNGPVHALSLSLYSPEEWAKETSPIPTPDCSSKGK